MSPVIPKEQLRFRDRAILFAALEDFITTRGPSAAPADYKIRKDCPVCRRFITKDQVVHPGTIDILPQADGWWQLMHTRCLRQMVAASYGAETVIDISGPDQEDR